MPLLLATPPTRYCLDELDLLSVLVFDQAPEADDALVTGEARSLFCGFRMMKLCGEWGREKESTHLCLRDRSRKSALVSLY